jgi:hypothetical protein
VRWIEEEKEHVDLFLVGRFGSGGRLAHRAGSGLATASRRSSMPRATICACTRCSASAAARGRPRTKTVDRAVDEAPPRATPPSYPWAGAISTHHTFLHSSSSAQRAFRTHFRSARTLGRALPSRRSTRRSPASAAAELPPRAHRGTHGTVRLPLPRRALSTARPRARSRARRPAARGALPRRLSRRPAGASGRSPASARTPDGLLAVAWYPFSFSRKVPVRGSEQGFSRAFLASPAPILPASCSAPPTGQSGEAFRASPPRAPLSTLPARVSDPSLRTR